MEGFKYNCHDPQRGIVPRSIEEIFRFIGNSSNEMVFKLKYFNRQLLWLELVIYKFIMKL